MEERVRYHGYVTMQSRGVLALPPEVRKRLLLNAPGAQVEVTEREDGVLELRAQMAVPVAQAWFWTEDWQRREREADGDVAAGRYSTHDDADTFLDALDG